MTQRRDLTWDYICELEARRDELLAALKRLSFCAQTSGGVAGKDPALMAAVNVARVTIKRATRATPK